MKASQRSQDTDEKEAIGKEELGTEIPVQVYELGGSVRRGKKPNLPQEEGPFGAFVSF